MQWRQVDLHLHTPASADWMEPDVTYLDILQVAERKRLDMIAFADHNTVAGYQAMMEELEQLKLLEDLGRLRDDERERLTEYRRLLDKIVVLPGFEFTATLGFHILGIFPPKIDVRKLEFILSELRVPMDKLDEGTGEVGATSDVITAYRVIDEAGGLAIAAHVDSSHGVAMWDRGLRAVSGQTRISYTQDPHLHALEVTDLEKKGRKTTARFFDGSRPEYPRRMHCIQGSDAHRLVKDPGDPKHLGVGDRVTQMLLPEVSFEALKELFQSNDFSRTRPYLPEKVPSDYIQSAREEGPSIVQEFHVSYTRRGGRLYAILSDVCAFANTNGGTIYVGVGPDPKERPAGVNNPSRCVNTLRSEIERRITPPLDVKIDVRQSQGANVVRIRVPRGQDVPYAIDESKIYVRSETETSMAVRDEIVNLIRRTLEGERVASQPEPSGMQIEPPRTGVEIVETEKRKGTLYHTMCDLRNGNRVQNVTRKSSKRLWHYAIVQAEDHPPEDGDVEWDGNIGLLRRRKHRGWERYDLVQREGDELHVYYGVTEDGLHGKWEEIVGLDND